MYFVEIVDDDNAVSLPLLLFPSENIIQTVLNQVLSKFTLATVFVLAIVLLG